MAARKLRYSERMAIAEGGNPGGPLEDAPSPPLQAALIHLIAQGEAAKPDYAFKSALRDAAIRHFGLVPEQADPTAIILNRSTDDFLDFIEIVCETASERYPVYSLA